MLSILISTLTFITSAHAYLPNAAMPACMDGPERMQIDNARVLNFKTTTRNQYLDRGFVKGVVIDSPNVRNGHDHFAISIGPGPKDTLEIVYNSEFGPMSDIRVGDPIVVCGDYITSTAATGRYPPSPEGALIHWVHFNPGSRAGSATHAHGFIMVGPNLIGFDEAPAGDWDGRIIKTHEPGKGLPEPEAKNPQEQAQQQRKQQQQNQQQKGRRRVGGWQPCRTIQECSARN